MLFSIGVFVTAFLMVGNFYFANKRSGYSNIKNTISELGETGSIYEKQAGFGLFLPVGILLAVIGFLATDNSNTMGLALSLATGYIIAALFPCDPGSPSSGTWKQQLHNLGGFMEYAGSILFIMKAAENGEHLFFIDLKMTGYLVIICIIITSFPKNPVRGLAQRIAELLLFSSLLYQLY